MLEIDPNQFSNTNLCSLKKSGSVRLCLKVSRSKEDVHFLNGQMGEPIILYKGEQVEYYIHAHTVVVGWYYANTFK